MTLHEGEECSDALAVPLDVSTVNWLADFDCNKSNVRQSAIIPPPTSGTLFPPLPTLTTLGTLWKAALGNTVADISSLCTQTDGVGTGAGKGVCFWA